MTETYLILLSALFGILYGFTEGINFFNPNPRQHEKFKLYHILNSLRFILAFIIAINNVFLYTHIVFSLGLLVFIWAMSEFAYNNARYDIKYFCYEHINFFEVVDFELYGKSVVILHIVRLAIAIMLIIGGSLNGIY